MHVWMFVHLAMCASVCVCVCVYVYTDCDSRAPARAISCSSLRSGTISTRHFTSGNTHTHTHTHTHIGQPQGYAGQLAWPAVHFGVCMCMCVCVCVCVYAQVATQASLEAAERLLRVVGGDWATRVFFSGVCVCVCMHELLKKDPAA